MKCVNINNVRTFQPLQYSDDVLQMANEHLQLYSSIIIMESGWIYAVKIFFYRDFYSLLGTSRVFSLE